MDREIGAIYYSSGAARDWQPDADVGGSNHMLFDHGRTMAGIWRADQDAARDPVSVAIPARETILVLEGTVTVTVNDGEPRYLRAGDMLSIPAQAMVGWDPAPDCMVFWVYS